MSSDYEKIRADNIARNEDYLSSVLGIAPKGNVKRKREEKSREQSKKPHIDESQLRRSSRSRSLIKVENFQELEIGENDDGCYPSRQKVTPSSLRQFIEEASPEHSKMVSDQAIVHCVHRLNSMSEKALSSRTKTIARAAGKNSLEKLLVSLYAMKAAGLTELIQNCEEALSRIEKS